MQPVGSGLRLLLDDEVAALAAELEGWQVQSGKLSREFRFANFVEAIAFIARVAVEAEALDHHPNWSNVYNRVQVELWTHALGGLSHLDFDLARKMNELSHNA